MPVLSRPALEFADQIGFYLENSGQTRLMGRVLGWLIACDPPLQSSQEIAAALSVSRSAVSTVTQALVESGLIDRVQVPGSREKYFRMPDNGWTRFQRQSLAQFEKLRHMSEKSLEALAHRDPITNRRLTRFRDYHTFLSQEAPALVDRWERTYAEETP